MVALVFVVAVVIGIRLRSRRRRVPDELRPAIIEQALRRARAKQAVAGEGASRQTRQAS